jgi:hypothetical protein
MNLAPTTVWTLKNEKDARETGRQMLHHSKKIDKCYAAFNTPAKDMRKCLVDKGIIAESATPPEVKANADATEAVYSFLIADTAEASIYCRDTQVNTDKELRDYLSRTHQKSHHLQHRYGKAPPPPPFSPFLQPVSKNKLP